MTDHKSLDAYADPIAYDNEGSAFRLDGTVLLELATQASGPVLELGCGTGKVTIPLARRRIEVTGLDVAPQMLERAKFKAPDLPIRWVCDDVRSFCLDERYALIFTAGAVFQHLLSRSDQEAMLARVREHLAPVGRFLIDVGFRHPKHLADVPEAQEWYTYDDDQGRTVQVSGTDHFDHLRQLWTQTFWRRVQNGEETQPAEPIDLVLRYIMPQEMEALLHYNGFNVLAAYGEWKGGPQTEEVHLHIYVCAKR